MTIRHLKIFIAVATYGKMRLAADSLYISQPAVSQAIKELENHYQIPLFDRISQRLYLTEAGNLLLTHARFVVNSFDNLDQMMHKKATSPVLKIGSSVSVGTYLLNDLLDQMEHLEYHPQFEIIVDNTSTIEDLINTSKVDVAIVEGVLSSDDLLQTPIYEDELVIIVGQGHPLFDTPFITLDALENQAWISREEGSMARNQYEQLLIEHNYMVNRTWVCSNTETIKQAVIHGRGIATISKMLIKKELQVGSLRILPVMDLTVTRSIHLIYHKDKYLSEPLKTFIKICKDLPLPR